MVQDGTIEIHYEIKDTGLHFMKGEAGGHEFMATGKNYSSVLGNAMQYIRLLGGDPLNIFVSGPGVEEMDKVEDDNRSKISLGEMQHKLDSAYDLVDEVVQEMRNLSWDALAERTHRLYEGLYVDAIQTIEEEGLIRESAK